METRRTIHVLRNILVVALITGVLGAFSSCAVKSKFLSSSVVPAAHGDVKVKTDNNNNYVIEVTIDNLAEVERLQTSKNSYVLWMETDQGRTINLGQLNSGSGFLSKRLKASLETKSSFKPARIFVTTELNSNVQYPDRDVILTTENF